jgi:hypothetical protein
MLIGLCLRRADDGEFVISKKKLKLDQTPVPSRRMQQPPGS